MYGYGSSNSSITFNPTTSKYDVTFAGKTTETTLTDKAAVADKWVRDILSIHANTPMVVGLDVEWRPNQYSWMTNKSATLQLCIDNKCLILQLFFMDSFPVSLKSFLMDPNFTFVGIAGLRMMKPLNVCRSNWDARVLTESQIEYACIDAYASFRVGYKLLIEK